MDFGTSLNLLAPFIIPIVALMIPLLAVYLSIQARIRRTQALHETIRQLGASGHPIPQALIDAASQDAPSGKAPWTPQAQFRAGALNVGVGLGLMGMFGAIGGLEKAPGWLWTLGLLPLCIGLALLAAWRLETRGGR
jgi:hypothetical protein